MPTSLKITTFNLLNYLEPPNAYYELDNIYTNEQWQKKQKWIADIIEETNADIICFQEVFSPESLQQLTKECGYPYFACIDSPTIEKDYLYSDPVLSIASRFPISTVVAAIPDNAVTGSYPFSEPFSFNRKPIHATVNIEGVGDLDIINVHLKSQRPTSISSALENETDLSEQQAQQKLGSWVSTVQRGFESHFLYHYIWQLKEKHGRPIIVAGDFNHSIQSPEISVLTSSHQAKDNDSFYESSLLSDAWDLYCEKFGKEKDFLQWSRIPTHYYGAIGNTLDYILVSAEFDEHNSHSRFWITDYCVTDRHIINPKFELEKLASDHAVVTLTVGVN